MWWTDEGHRKTHRCRNPTSFSTTDRLCGMRLLSPTRKLWVLPGAAHLCASPSNRSLLPPSSTTVFAIPRGVLEAALLPTGRFRPSRPEHKFRPSLCTFLPSLHEFGERQPDNLSDLQAAHRLSNGFEFLQDFRIEENIVPLEHGRTIHTLERCCIWYVRTSQMHQNSAIFHYLFH